MSSETDQSMYQALRRWGHYAHDRDAEGRASGGRALAQLQEADAEALSAFWAESIEDGVPCEEVLDWVDTLDGPSERTAPIYQRLADHPPPNANFYYRYNLARALRVDCADPGRAIGLLERIVEGGTRDADVWLELGNARRDAGLGPPAVTAWQHAIALSPEDPRLRRSLAHHHMGHQQWAQATAVMAECCAHSERAEDLHVYGHCLQEAAQPDAAVAALERAVALYAARGSDPSTQFWQAAALARMGNADAACALLARAVAARPDLAEDAATEEDFASVRGSDAWRAALGG